MSVYITNELVIKQQISLLSFVKVGLNLDIFTEEVLQKPKFSLIQSELQPQDHSSSTLMEWLQLAQEQAH